MTKTNTILGSIVLALALVCGALVFTACDQPVILVSHTVTFNANGGSGEMAAETEVFNKYNLPVNGFTAPEGKAFKCWQVGTEEKAVGEKIEVTEDIEVKALWKDTTPIEAKQLKVTYDEDFILVGEVVDLDTITIECAYSDGSVEEIAIEEVEFYIGDYDITEHIDEPIPAEGVYEITAKYAGMKATFKVVAVKEYGEILEYSQEGNEYEININFANMQSDEDLDAIFSPSIENLGIRDDDSGLCLAHDLYGNAYGASIVEEGAWIRYREANFKIARYAFEITVNTEYMEEGTQVRFHADEAVAWAGDFGVLEQAEEEQVIRYEFYANDQGYIVIEVYTNGTLTNTVVSTATVEDFAGGTANKHEGICWAVYDFNNTDYTGGAVITSMKLQMTLLD